MALAPARKRSGRCCSWQFVTSAFANLLQVRLPAHSLHLSRIVFTVLSVHRSPLLVWSEYFVDCRASNPVRKKSGLTIVV